MLLDAVKREISDCSKAGDFYNPAITELSVDASFKATKSPQQKEGPTNNDQSDDDNAGD